MNRCKLPWSGILIEVDGTVKCCCFQKKPLGNLNISSLEEIWNGHQFKLLRDCLNRGDYRTFCQADCPNIPSSII